MPTPIVGTGPFAGLDYWYSSLAFPHQADIGQNVTAAPLHYETIIVPVDHLDMGPEADDVDLRFTAINRGDYSISGDFLGIDVSEHSHPVGILKNRVVIFNGTIGSYGQSDPFHLIQSLNAGDVIDFDVFTGQDVYYFSTGLAATINPSVPEPASIWIAGLGLTALSLAGRNRKGTAPRN